MLKLNEHRIYCIYFTNTAKIVNASNTCKGTKTHHIQTFPKALNIHLHLKLPNYKLEAADKPDLSCHPNQSA